MSGINSLGLLIYQKRQSDLSIIGSRYSISEEKILDHKLDDESMCQDEMCMVTFGRVPVQIHDQGTIRIILEDLQQVLHPSNGECRTCPICYTSGSE